jgi:uncharacterized protein (TIGR02466 family)
MSNYKEIWVTPLGEYNLNNTAVHQEMIDAYQKNYEIEDGTKFNILDNSNCSNFEKWVLECCADYTSHFLESSNCRITRSWITTAHYGEQNHFHTHGDSDIVGVYYLETNENHPPLQVFDPRTPHSLNSTNIIEHGKIVCENIRYITINPTQGKLVLLPGYLLHGVLPNLDKHPRVSVAMNVSVK